MADNSFFSRVAELNELKTRQNGVGQELKEVRGGDVLRITSMMMTLFLLLVVLLIVRIMFSTGTGIAFLDQIATTITPTAISQSQDSD